MTTLVTKETGGCAPLVTAATVTAPAQAMPPEELEQFMAGSGLNGTAFLADLFSSFLAHEQMGWHLYRTVAGLTTNPTLKEKYEQFGEETRNHIRIFEELIVAAGGRPGYVSCSARLTQATGMKIAEAATLLPDGAGINDLELAMLEAVVLAETKCHADWEIVAQLTDKLPDGALKAAFVAAVAEVEEQEDEHLNWAKDTWSQMIMRQAESSMLDKGLEAVQSVAAKVKDVLT